MWANHTLSLLCVHSLLSVGMGTMTMTHAIYWGSVPWDGCIPSLAQDTALEPIVLFTSSHWYEQITHRLCAYSTFPHVLTEKGFIDVSASPKLIFMLAALEPIMLFTNKWHGQMKLCAYIHSRVPGNGFVAVPADPCLHDGVSRPQLSAVE